MTKLMLRRLSIWKTYRFRDDQINGWLGEDIAQRFHFLILLLIVIDSTNNGLGITKINNWGRHGSLEKKIDFESCKRKRGDDPYVIWNEIYGYDLLIRRQKLISNCVISLLYNHHIIYSHENPYMSVWEGNNCHIRNSRSHWEFATDLDIGVKDNTAVVLQKPVEGLHTDCCS